MTTENASLLLQAAARAAAGQTYPAGALYVVATPIGNLADITLRAIHVLATVDAIGCEDTRHTAALLHHLGIDKPLLALHEHNEHAAAAQVLARLARGERVAYVSDAGSPAVSDPGAALVAAAAQAGHRCIPIPGASAGVAALSVAGEGAASTTATGHTFIGFLAARGPARATALAALAADPRTQVLYEAPHRIESLCATLAHACGPRRATLGRELTKQFETVVTLPAADLPAWLAADPNRLRGEFVLVLHALSDAAPDAAGTHDRTLNVLLAALPLKQAVALATELTGAPRNALYARALALKGEAH